MSQLKLIFFTWRLAPDRLVTRVVLDRRDIDLAYLCCSLCEDALESSSHLFFNYSLSVSIIFQVSRRWGFPNSTIACYVDWLVWFKAFCFLALSKWVLEGVFMWLGG